MEKRLAKDKSKYINSPTQSQADAVRFIRMGMDLEVRQCVMIQHEMLFSIDHSSLFRLWIRRKVDADSEDSGSPDIQKDRLRLFEDIEEWRLEQNNIMPGLSIMTPSNSDKDPASHGVPCAEGIDLLLPSAISKYGERVTQHSWFKGLSNIERQLRRGEANDAMQALVAALQYEDAIQAKKRKHAKGQKAITRAQGLVNTASEWSVNEAVLYEQARRALWELGDEKDKGRYRALKPSDTKIKGIYGRKQLGDGWKTDSWIMEFGKRNIDDSNQDSDTKEWEEEGLGSLILYLSSPTWLTAM